MIRWLLARLGRVGTGLAGLVVALALFWWIAPYNIAASVPHAPGISALLHGYLKNAIRTWSFGETPPEWLDVDDPALVRLGAGHFEANCAPCHAAPGRERNPLVRQMLPAPPKLDHVGEYALRELWWIGRNGFKYSGMPAWPAERDDEPWAIAAFLRAYPTLDADRYRELAYGEVAEKAAPWPRAMDFGHTTGGLTEIEDCARCHGLDGMGRDGTAPRLAGQSEAYLAATLEAYAGSTRPSGFMIPLAAALAPEVRSRLAAEFASMPGFRDAPGEVEDPAAYGRGEALANAGDEHLDLPSCLSCHGPEALAKQPAFPAIFGQERRWLVVWLHQWREGAFGGTRWAGLMHKSARMLTDRQIEDLATYFAAGDQGRLAAGRK